ncbi:MAG: GGDEF domain-containing protein [Sulfurimonas sp.]|uniref:EAL domain-containing protein n=1 Tax=Sulfurimonas sp. TaxID=2022749 RepID=UPI0025E72E3F|nr:EAL domain-containing protein [Sulfurimonas sp.]MCK9490497.1 GGDEF domain-containing protein [Sulfurimonas sp.]
MKTLIYIIAFLIATFAISSTIYSNHIDSSEQIKASQEEAMLKSKLLQITKDSIEQNNLELFKNAIYILKGSSSLVDAKLELKNYTFSDKILLEMVYLKESDWFISDVTIDVNIAQINTTKTGVYKLTLADDKQELQSVNIKFQAIKDSVIKDFLVPLEIKTRFLQSSEVDSTTKLTRVDQDTFSLWISYKSTFNQESLDAKLDTFMLALGSLLLVITIFAYLLYRFVIYKSLKSSMDNLNLYLTNVLKGKMLDFKEQKTNFKELDLLSQNSVDLSKKFINTTNDLTVSRDIIYQKERSDELTGLPNKKSFENDLKYMFISSREGYVIYLKIDKIGIFTKNHGPEIVNSLIEDFAKTVQHYFHSQRDRDGVLYRFFGGEFSMLLYEKDLQKVEDTLNEILKLIDKLVDKYYFFDRSIYFGAVPFDQYGTIESNIENAQEAYESALAQKSKFYHIVDLKQQAESMKKLEGSIKDIIKRNDFVLQYLHDTVEFGDEPKTLIQEISPLIIDSFTFENIPTGKFISVAERLGVVADFDKALIIKALEQIELGEIEHQICIVLSVSTITNKLFMSWLQETSKENKFMQKIIFTSPSYSVASNFEEFSHFYSVLRELNIETMIKKYDPTDLNLDSFKELKPTYLKLDRSFCQDFKKDSTKHGVVKQIIEFSHKHNIKVIGDSLKSKQDYLAFEMLGVYGTSS